MNSLNTEKNNINFQPVYDYIDQSINGSSSELKIQWRKEIKGLRTELHIDMKELGKELRTEIKDLRKEFKQDLKFELQDVVRTKDLLPILQDIKTDIANLAGMIKDMRDELSVNGYRVDRLETWAGTAGVSIEVPFSR